MSLLLFSKPNYVYSDTEVVYDLQQLAWVPEIANDCNVLYSIQVTGISTEIPYAIRVSSDTEISYAIRQYIEADTEIIYSILVSNDIEVEYGIIVSVDYDFRYSIGFIYTDIEIVYSLRGKVVDDTEVIYDLSPMYVYSNTEISYSINAYSDTNIDYSIREFIWADFEILYNLTVEAHSDTEVLYDMSTTTFIYNDMRVIYSLIGNMTESIDVDISVTLDANVIDIDFFQLSIDSESYCWSLTGVLSTLEAWSLCTPGSTLTVEIGSDTYLFIIDSRDRDNTNDDDIYSLEARSITSVFGSGATPIHKTWEDVQVSDVIEEITPGTVQEIPSWFLPAGTLTVEGETPVAILQLIANDSGAGLYTTGEGVLVITSKYKEPPTLLEIGATDYTISDHDDIYRLVDTKETRPGYNAVEVSDEPEGGAGSISLEEITDSRNEVAYTTAIRANVYPFVTSLELLSSYSGVVVPPSLIELNETLTETIEIINGEGRVSRSVRTINSFVYNDTDLGDLTADNTSITAEIEGTTMVDIEYVTSYHRFEVDVGSPISVQVYLED